MRNLVILALTPFIASPAFAGYPFGPYPQPTKARMMAEMGRAYQTAQYMPTQYYPAQMMGGGGSPVIVPPTVINTQGYEHNSSKKSCKESVIDMFLFSVRRTTGDCTP